MKRGALEGRAQDITRWVTEALNGLGYAARPLPMGRTWRSAKFHQGVALWSRDVNGTRSELQDTILGAVSKAIEEGHWGLVSRGADPSWGWRVLETADISGDERWMPGMPQFCCFMEWNGPRPDTWPHQIALGMKENLMSRPLGRTPTWEGHSGS